MRKSPIPEDVMKAACDAYLSYPRKGEDEWLPTARAIMAERKRCAEIAKNCRITVPLMPGAADGASMASKQISSAIMAGREGE